MNYDGVTGNDLARDKGAIYAIYAVCKNVQ